MSVKDQIQHPQTYLQRSRLMEAMRMRQNLRNRILRYAADRRHEAKWKKRIYALSYGASVSYVLKGKV